MFEPEIRPLTPEGLADYLAFFDRDAFVDGNEDWAGCYCYFYHTPADSAEAWRADCASGANRAGVAALIGAGKMSGYLAYDATRVVGWCHAAPRSTLPNLPHVLGISMDPDEAVGSIVCFNIAGPYRRQGLARRLLAAACDGFARQGLRVVEAYPARRSADARHYHGPLAIYEEAGFIRVRELDHYYLMRKPL